MCHKNVGAVSYIMFLCWVRVEQQDSLQQRLIFIVTQPSTHINTGKDTAGGTAQRTNKFTISAVQSGQRKTNLWDIFWPFLWVLMWEKGFFMSARVNSLWITVCVVSVIVINNKIWFQIKSPSTNTTWMCMDRCSEYEPYFTYLC